jgi:cation-transporting P-type ATPase E
MTTHAMNPKAPVPEPESARPSPALAGLTDAEVRERLARGQRNVFVHKSARSVGDIIRENVFTIFNIILFLTLGATLLLSLTSRYNAARQVVVGDSLFSGGTVWLNMLVGIFQELRAKRQLDQLAALSVRNVRVRRNGKTTEVPVDQVVLDDLVELRPGDRAPVDGSLLECHAMEMDESLLTGESDSITKNVGDQVYSGSFCLVGGGTLRAEGIGADSYANKLTTTARAVKDPLTPLQHKINFVVQFLVIVMAVIAVLNIVAAPSRNDGAIEALRYTTVIITSFVPAGLILAITVSLSVGAVRISRFDTLVQRINAIESMGNVTVLCVDKTGTLTRNALAVERIVPLGAWDESTVKELLAAYVVSTSSPNKTAGAIADYVGAPVARHEVVREVPFSSERKWSALVLRDAGSGERTYVLGSPELILPEEPFGEQDPLSEDASSTSITGRIAQATRQGLRVVAFVTSPRAPGDGTLPDEREPVALVVIRDEIRPDISQTLKEFEEQGVRVKVISGDSADTIRAIAVRAGMRVHGVVTEQQLAELSGPAFDAAVRDATLFGRITPDTKRRIVASLTRQGEYVAMVGDGVNDVPALKEARLGIAMNDGAQITKDVSDLVLLKNAMSTLPRALKEGQSITQKIYASAKLYLAKNAITIFAILFAGFVGLPFPGEPRQISWVASITVAVPCTLLAFGLIRPAYTRKFLNSVLGYSLLVGAIGAVVVVAVYILSHMISPHQNQARTAFALVNLHFAIHVFWDVHDVSIFSPISMRKHPRETLVGLGLLVVGMAAPVLLPGLLIATPPMLEEWLMILLFPILGSFVMRRFIYGRFMRDMARTLGS